MAPEKVAEETDLSARTVMNTLHKLEEVGAAQQLSSGKVRMVTSRPIEEVAQDAEQQQEELSELKRFRLEQMREYADQRGCRRAFLLRYFGDVFEGPCGNCDNCEAAGMTRRAA